MKITSVQRVATAMTVCAICLMAVAAWIASANVREAARQHAHALRIGRTVTQLRLLTFEFVVHRHDRAKAQWQSVSSRLEGLIGRTDLGANEERQLIARLKENKSEADALFAELASPEADVRAAPLDATTRRYRDQLVDRLAIRHQQALVEAYDLADLSVQHIDSAQRRFAMIIAVGIGTIALTTTAASWLVHGRVLAPLERLRQAALEITGGKPAAALRVERDDEIGELARAFDDMTRAQRRSLDVIEASNRELSALNAELEAFSYSVSHDLRAPLRSLDGFSLVLLEDYGDRLDEEGKDAIRRIRAASQYMGNLIDDLLRLSRVSRAELTIEEVDVTAMAHEIAALVQTEGVHAAADWQIEQGIRLRADKALLRIALHNLMQNAWKFTAKAERPVIRVGMARQDSRTPVFVADNGIGFDMAYVSQLFGAFRRLHSATDFPGNGIGLAIVERIVRRHHGKIWAQGAPGGGATFSFMLAQDGG